MDQRDVVALEVVVDVNLPVARDVPAVAPHELHRAELDRGNSLSDASIDARPARRRRAAKKDPAFCTGIAAAGRRHQNFRLPFRRRNELAFLVVRQP
jgi:hypothetical protein